MIVGLDQAALGVPKIGKFKMLLYGLCEICSSLPDVHGKAEVVALQESTASIC